MSPIVRSAVLLLSLIFSGSLLGPGALAAPVHQSSALIRTMDLDDTVAWYRDKLGFRVVSDVTRVQARAVVLERSGFLLEISEDEKVVATAAAGEPDVDTTGSAGPTINYLVSDVDAELDRLRASGVEVVAEPQDELDGRFRVAFIRDNGGRLVELREPLGSGADFHARGR